MRDRINWASSVELELEFKTEVRKSRNGLEKRVSQRFEPRTFWEFSTLSTEPHIDVPLSRSGFYPGLWVKAANPFFGKAAQAQAGDTFTAKSPGGFSSNWWAPGSEVEVVAAGSSSRASVVTRVGDTLQLDTDTGFPGGTLVKIYAVEWTRERESLVSNFSTSQVRQNRRKVETRSLSKWRNGAGYPGVGSLFGRPVVAFRHNWADEKDVSWPLRTEQADTGYSLPVVSQEPVEPGPTYTVSELLTYDGALDLAGLFCQMRGQAGDFYAATGVQDLVFTAPLAAGETEVEVRGSMAHDLFQSSPVFRRIWLPGGPGLKVAQTALSGENTRLTLLGAIPPENAGLRGTSWLLRVRFGLDRLRFSFLSSSSAQVQFTLKALPDLSPEIQIGGKTVLFAGSAAYVGGLVERTVSPASTLATGFPSVPGEIT